MGNLLSNFSPETDVMRYICSFIYGCSKWSYFPLFPWLAYPLIGIAFYQFKKQYGVTDINKSISDIFKKPEAQRFFKQMMGVVFFLFLLLTGRYAVSVASNLPSYYHHEFIFMVWTLIFLALYSFNMNEINNFAREFILFKYIKWLGKNVTIMYVLQWILIGNTATEIYKTVTSPLYLVIYFFAVLGIASGISYLLIGLKERFFKKAV